MNWKRVITLGFLGITLGVGQSYGLDINIPGAFPPAPEDSYQHYRIDPKVTRLMEQSIEKEIPAIRAKDPNYDRSQLESDIYATKELNNAVMYSRTVLILRDNRSDIKFTAPYESGIGIARLDNTKDVVRMGRIFSRIAQLGYEVRPQPKGNLWENTNIEYSKLNSDILRKEFEGSKGDIRPDGSKMLGSGTFAYKGIEKATWDVIKYDSDNIIGTLNFTLPTSPTRSYHIGYQMSDRLNHDVLKDNEQEIMNSTMAPLVNTILPSIKPASAILENTTPVRVENFTFQVFKNSKHIGRETLKNGGYKVIYSSGNIKEEIIVTPLSSIDNVKKQNVLFNYLNDFVYTEALSKRKPIQSATVWNDATPGVYLEVEGDKYTLFTMTVYDENYRYTYMVKKPHDIHVSNYKIRDMIQYVDNKKNKTNYDKIKLGLGVPPDIFGDTKIFNK